MRQMRNQRAGINGRRRRLGAVAVFVIGALAASLLDAAIASPAAQAAPGAATAAPTEPAAPLTTIPTGAPGGYQPLASTRVLDTRTNLGAAGPVNAGQTIHLALSGIAGVPASGVEAVALHVTAIDATKTTAVTVFTSGIPRPNTPTFRAFPGRPMSHLVFLPVGADGTVSFFVRTGRLQLLGDVQGWFPTSGDYHALSPARVSQIHVGSGATVEQAIAGVAGVPSSGVESVVLNVVATKVRRDATVTVWPSGEARPPVANLRFRKGQPAADLVVVPLGANGKVSFFNEVGDVDAIVNVNGWIADGGAYTALTPARVLDTQQAGAAGRVNGGQSIDVAVAGVGVVPSTGVAAVLLDLAAVTATNATSVTAWPTGATRPGVRSLNAPKGGRTSNLVVVPIGADGKVSLFNEVGKAHLTLDVVGWFAALGEDPVNPAVAWRFVPRQMLLSPGESRQSTLTQTDANGKETAAELPEGTTFATTGTGDAITVTAVGGGVVQITAGSNIDSVIVGAQIPGVSPAPTLAVTVATVKAGVVKIPDDVVLFPQTDLPVDGNIGELLQGDVDRTGVGPFPWADVVARTFLPDGKAEALVPDQPLPEDAARVPVVLHNPVPPTGTVIVATGGSALMGRIVEPDGLPTLSIGDYSLLSVALVGLQDIYQDLAYDVDADALSSIGALPGTSPAAPEPLAPAGHLGATKATAIADDDNTTFSGVNGGGEPETRNSLQKLDDCTKEFAGQLGGQFGELQPGIDVGINPVVNAFIIIQDGTLQKLRIEVGGTLTVTVQLAVKLQATIFAKLSCPLAKLGEVEMMAPGPFAALLSFKGTAEQRIELSLKLEGGPKVEAGVSCTMAATFIGGFDWANTAETGGTFTDRSRGTVTPPTCTPKFQPSTSLSSSGVAASIEIIGGLPLVMPAGLQLGGKVVGFLLKVIKWATGEDTDGIGYLDALRAEVGPQARWAWENATNTLSFEKAKSTLALELSGKINLELKPWHWLLGKFGLGVTPVFKVKLYQETIPLLSAYQPLNVKKLTYTVNGGEETVADQMNPEVIDVVSGDHVHLRSEMEPANGGLLSSLAIAQLESGSVWRLLPVGYDENHDFAIAPTVPSGEGSVLGKVALDLNINVDDSMCERYGDEAVQFAVTGNAPFLSADIPAWGGKFKLQCGDGHMRFSPLKVTGQPAARAVVKSFLVSEGDSNDRYRVDTSTVPDWVASITPVEGELGPVQSLNEIAFEIKGRLKTCEVQPARSAVVHFLSMHRGEANITVEQPEVPIKRNCTPQDTGLGTGDPHMMSMDGLRYDAQVVGEYVWLRPTEGNTGPVLHVRQELTVPESTGLARPTSATAVALELEGHKIEVYQRPAFLVLVDGVVTDLADGVPIDVSPDVSLVRSGTVVSVQGDGFDLGINGIDVSVSVPVGSPLEGLLGSPDGIQANDLAVAGTSVTYTLAEIREHGAALYAMTDSWRVTNSSESLFTNSYPGFDDVNPPHNSSDLDDERAQVRFALGNLNHICTGDVGAGAYVVDALAFELAIGRPLNDLSRFTCNYIVQGQAALANTPGIGVSGLTVRIDGVGVQPCTTTSGSNGVYSCRLVPDLNEIDSPLSLPLQFQVTAAWPDAPLEVVATRTAEFESLAPVEGAPLLTDAPLTLDASTVPLLHVTGKMTGVGGAPLAGPITMGLTVFDANGVVIDGGLEAVTPAADGSYTIDRYLPHGAVRVDAEAAVGYLIDHVKQSFIGLSPGQNSRVLDVDYQPAILQVSGTLLGAGGQPLTGERSLRIQRTLSDGTNLVTNVVVTPDAATGAYSLERVLERDTVRAEITALIGFNPDWKSVVVDPTVPGPNPVTLDVTYVPPVLDLSGTMTRDGAPIVGPMTLVVLAFDESDTAVFGWLEFASLDSAGAYHLPPVTLPKTAVRATVTPYISPFEAENPTIELTGLVPGNNARTVNATDVSRRLVISGTVLRDGVPSATSIAVVGRYFDSADNQVGTSYEPVSVAGDGSYNVSFRIPTSATRGSIDFYVAVEHGGGGTDTFTLEATGLTAGVNNRTFDIDAIATAVAVSGTIKWLGVTQSGSHTFLITSRDTDGNDLGTQFVPVTIAADGTYSFVRGIPTASAEVVVAVTGVAHSDGRFNVIAGSTYDVVSGETTDIVHNLDSLGLGMAGYVYEDGVLQVDRDLDLVVTVHDGTSSEANHTVTVHTNDDGSYELADTQVLFSGSIDRVTVDDVYGNRVLDLTGVTPGVYDSILDIDLTAPPRGLLVQGTITQDGAPYVGDGTVDIEFRPYAFDQADYYSSPPYALAFVEPIYVWDAPVLETGVYGVSIPGSMPYTVTAVEVRVTVGGDTDPVTYSQAVVLPAHSHEDIAIPFDIQHDTPRLTLTGHALAVPECGGRPFIFTVDIWTFDSTAPTEYDDATGTWEGGVKQVTRVVVPDPETGAFDLTMWMPDGTVRLGLRMRVSDAYEQLAGGTTQIRESDFGGISTSTWDVNAGCLN